MWTTKKKLRKIIKELEAEAKSLRRTNRALLNGEIDDEIRPLRFEQMDVAPAISRPGDTVHLILGGEEVMKRDIDVEMVIDTVAVFWIEDSLGFTKAVCGAFGQSEDNYYPPVPPENEVIQEGVWPWDQMIHS